MKWNPMDECDFIWCRWVRGVFVLWFDWNRVQVTKQQMNMGWKKIGIWCMSVWSHEALKTQHEKAKTVPMAETKIQKMTLMRTLIYVHCLGLVWEWRPAILWNAAQLAWSSLLLSQILAPQVKEVLQQHLQSHILNINCQLVNQLTLFFNCFSEWRQTSIKATIPQKKNQSNTLCSNFYLLKVMRRDDGLQGLGFSVQMHDLQFTHCKTYLQLNTRLKHPATHCSNTIFFLVQIQKKKTYSEFEFKN